MATIATLSVLVEAKGQRQFLGSMTKIAAAVGAAGVAMDQLLERGGKIQPVLRAFSRRVGNQEAALQRLRGATMGLVSDYDLMQQANVALTLGSANTAEEFAELANVAQRLGRALGLDTAFALNSLNTGIARQSRLMLDNIGLIVSAEDANEAYAAAIGRSVDELTVAQQKEAFRIAALEQARQKVEELGSDTRTAADAWDGLKVEIQNTTDALATFLAGSEGTAGFLDGVTQDIRILRFEFEQFMETRNAALASADRTAFGANIPVETGATGRGAKSPQERMAELNAESEAWREQAAAVRAAFEETMAFEEQLDFLGSMIREVRVAEINPLTGELLDFGSTSHLTATQWIPELDTSMQDATVAADVLRLYMEALNEELSDTEKASRAAALGLRGVTGLGQLFGFAIPGLSNIFGGLGFLQSLAGLDSLFGGGKAHGGPVSSGTAYMVGERGPEMFVPNQNGTIIPNGGITINVPPAPDPITAAADARWQRAIAETFRNLEGNGFRAAPA